MQNSIQKFFGHTQLKFPNSSKDFFQDSLETIFALPKSDYRIPGRISISGFQREFFLHTPNKKFEEGERGTFFEYPSDWGSIQNVALIGMEKRSDRRLRRTNEPHGRGPDPATGSNVSHGVRCLSVDCKKLPFLLH